MLLALPIKPARHTDGLCKGPVLKGFVPLFWVEDKKTIFRDLHINLSRKEWMITYINNRLKLASSDGGAFRRKIIWLSNLDGDMPASGINIWKLMHELGYFGRVVEEALLICKVKTDCIHKPTWVDAGFTFYWYAAPEKPDHGQTRSLRDGKIYYKEWVTKKETVTIEDVEIFPMAATAGTDILELTDLPDEYLENCANEVIARRHIKSKGRH